LLSLLITSHVPSPGDDGALLHKIVCREAEFNTRNQSMQGMKGKDPKQRPCDNSLNFVRALRATTKL
jgi:hypothetical protein